MKKRLLINRTENTDSGEKMDPIMKAIKAVRSNGGTADVNSVESLEKQRHNQELLSRLVTPTAGVTYEKDSVGSIPIEWVIPDYAHREDKIILYCHGGGFTCGGLGYAGILAGKLSVHTGLRCICYEYRLAPENPYPSAIEDTVTIWDYLMKKGYGAKDIIVAGDSAGGNLALELALILKAQRRIGPKALVLMSPWTDMTMTSSSYAKYRDLDPMLTEEYIADVRSAYVGCDADFTNPSLSPLFADLSGMPPTLIQAGSNEILRGDSEHLAKKLLKQDCLCALKIYTGGWHVFQQMPTPKATKALDDIKKFLDSIL